MDSTKKNIQKTSGTRKRYKPGQLVTINQGNRITDGTQNSSIGEKQSYTSK